MANNDNEVRMRTGFKSLNHLLAFVMIVCNGGHNVMIHKATKLTWLEEWFSTSKYLWGRTLTCWWGTKAVTGTHRSSTQAILHDKLEQTKTCCQS